MPIRLREPYYGHRIYGIYGVQRTALLRDGRNTLLEMAQVRMGGHGTEPSINGFFSNETSSDTI